MKLQWSETAIGDLLSIQRYIAIENPSAAKKWVERLRLKAAGIVHAPYAGRKVPEFARDDIRELIEGNYRIVYHLHAEQVSILTVFEAHRLLPLKDLS